VVLPLWVVENRPPPLLWPLAYTTACTTVQAVINFFGFTIAMLEYDDDTQACLAATAVAPSVVMQTSAAT